MSVQLRQSAEAMIRQAVHGTGTSARAADLREPRTTPRATNLEVRFFGFRRASRSTPAASARGALPA